MLSCLVIGSVELNSKIYLLFFFIKVSKLLVSSKEIILQGNNRFTRVIDYDLRVA